MTRRYTALINPISGGGRAAARWAPVADRLRAAGSVARAELTESHQHAVDLARAAAAAGETVVAVGGDGLVRDVAIGVYGTGAAMGIVPAGRGNDLARHLGLPTDPAGLADVLLTGPERIIDVIEIGDTVVVGNVYAGMDSVSTAIINRLRRLPGRLAYRLGPVLAAITWRAPSFTLTVDGETITQRAHIVVLANSGDYGHGLRIVPPASVDNGVLKVLTVDAGPILRLSRFMSEAKTGAHIAHDDVTIRDGREVTLAADRPVPVNGDGDYLGELPATVRIRPAALPVLVPPSHRPAAPRN